MDMMIPFLGRISRLQVEPKGAFYIAGLKDSNAQRIELEKRRKSELSRRELLLKQGVEDETAAITEDEDGKKHLDTWA